jgi:hypothetical protein
MHDFDIPKVNLHPKLPKMPKHIADFNHLILYGPQGVGKYTQMLRIVQKYSAHKLKYEKRVVIQFNDAPYAFKISDIHYEIDMDMLGCTPKLLFHEIYVHIKDIVQSNPVHHGIVVCKNFNFVNKDLLDIFYSYMQDSLKFILLTDAVSFIPESIMYRSRVVAVARPPLDKYVQCFGKFVPNLKSAVYGTLPDTRQQLCDGICRMIETQNHSFAEMREKLYSILIYNLNVDACVWLILSRMLTILPAEKHSQLLVNTVRFFQYFNNNYRPIFHLEHYVYGMVSLL